MCFATTNLVGSNSCMFFTYSKLYMCKLVSCTFCFRYSISCTKNRLYAMQLQSMGVQKKYYVPSLFVTKTPILSN